MQQMTIFDFVRQDEKKWEHFRDCYCSHKSGIVKFDEYGHYSKSKDGEKKCGCTFKNEKTAHCWDEWQICSYENCPFIKEGNR